MRAKSNIVLRSYDSIFQETESNRDVTSLVLEKLHTFPDHPYSVPDNEELEQLTDSIKESGILTPVMVLPRKDVAGEYYIISGHRRCAAAKKAGLQEVPCIIRDISMNQAIIEMVDTNIYRETILPSEKARAYEMRLAAMTGQRKSGQIEVESGKRTDQELAEQLGESRATIHRYLRLNKLVPELRFKVDQDMIPLNAGVALSYLDEKTQAGVAEKMDAHECTLTLEKAEKLKDLAEEGELNSFNLQAVIYGWSRIYTKKEINKAVKQNVEAICGEQAGYILTTYGQGMTEQEAEDFLRMTMPQGSRRSMLRISKYTKTGVRLEEAYGKYTRDIPYEQMVKALCTEWEKDCAEEKVLFPSVIKKLNQELLTELLGKKTFEATDTPTNYLLQWKSVKFASKLACGTVKASIRPDSIIYTGNWNGSQLESTGCSMFELTEQLAKSRSGLQKQVEKVQMQASLEAARKEQIKQESYHKANLALKQELRDVILHHPAYSMNDVDEKLREVQSMPVNGKDRDILNDALTILKKYLVVAEEQSQACWLPKMSVSERKAWLSDYPAWGVWHYDPVENAKYYRMDFADGSGIVVKATPYYAYWCSEIRMNHSFYLLPADECYCTLRDCKSYEADCLRHLTNVYAWQNQHPEQQINIQEPEEIEEEEMAMSM